MGFVTIWNGIDPKHMRSACSVSTSFVTIWNGIDPKRISCRHIEPQGFVTIWNGIDPKPQIHEFGLLHIENMIHPRGTYYSSKH